MSQQNTKSTDSRAEDLQSRLTNLAEGGAGAINGRIQEIDREWSAGRVGKSVLAVIILIGTVLATTVNAWWLILPVVAGLFMLQYLFSHTSLLVEAMEGVGFRTRAEIEQEKFALRTLRGDFRNLPTLFDIEDKDDITRLEGEGGIVIDDDDERKVDSKDAVKEVIQAVKQEEPAAQPSVLHS
jgi:hypothetical protein